MNSEVEVLRRRHAGGSRSDYTRRFSKNQESALRSGIKKGEIWRSFKEVGDSMKREGHHLMKLAAKEVGEDEKTWKVEKRDKALKIVRVELGKMRQYVVGRLKWRVMSKCVRVWVSREKGSVSHENVSNAQRFGKRERSRETTPR